jgi:hypothetical protein
MLQLKKVSNDDDGISQSISKPLNNTEFDYYLILEIIDWKIYNDSQFAPLNRYHYSISAVSFFALTQEKKKCIQEQLQDLQEYSDVTKAMETYNYGMSACLWSGEGTKKELHAESRKQLELIPSLFGFYMDKRQNGMGATGWDTIQGNLMPSEV